MYNCERERKEEKNHLNNYYHLMQSYIYITLIELYFQKFYEI